MAKAKEKKAAPQVNRARLLVALMLLAALVSCCLAAVFAVSGGGGTAGLKVGAAVYAALAFVLFAAYMLLQLPSECASPKLMSIICIQLVLMPWVQLVCNMIDLHITPMLMAAMLTAELVGDRAAFAVTGLLAAFSVLLNSGGELLSAQSAIMPMANAAGGVAAVFALKKTNTRGVMIAASGIGGAAGAAVAAMLYLVAGSPVRDVLLAAGCVFFSGLFCGLLVIGSLTVWERLFDVATTARLNELLNTNQPLLKQLMYDAPGTYQHSMNVAALAEAAAERIGANPLLARVGAIYHDVGKLRRPIYFMENQRGENIHDTLPPAESASIITAHQKDGVTLLTKHKLPGAVIRIASEHHGNSLVAYFYHKAAAEGGEVNPKAFRYTGGRPSTRESAIVLLADCCEAAVRSLGDCTREAREAMVHKVIWSKLTDGENMLSEAPLTIGDISDIERSFLRTFGGLMHERIEYPEEARKE